MMRSMFSGVSGLRAHQTRMDVIGNNVANVNTVGFKSGRVTFGEIFSQTLKGAGAPDASTGRGGTNPMQVGLGIGVNGVDTIMTRGSLQRTDNPTDLSIEGDGFFVLKSGTGTYNFTRAGNFGVDKLGNLVSGSGLNVQGWQVYTPNSDGTYTFDTEKPIEAINLYSDAHNGNKRVIAAKATANAILAGNLDSSKAPMSGSTDLTTKPATPPATPQFSVPMTVYDNLGNPYKINVNFSKLYVDSTTNPASPVTSWYWNITDPSGLSSEISGTAADGVIEFDANGKILADDASTAGAAPSVVNISCVPAGTVGTDPFTVKLDFNKVSMFAADSSVKPTNVDGYPTGNLVTFNIGSDGIITGIYSNGQQQPLGMVALASFENPAGLQKVGDNMYIPTTNSGDFKKAVKAGAEGVGTLNPGTLEMSNVDLSKEFTDMIVTQRGFQANSRIITTSDEMLQELVNLKR